MKVTVLLLVVGLGVATALRIDGTTRAQTDGAQEVTSTRERRSLTLSYFYTRTKTEVKTVTTVSTSVSTCVSIVSSDCDRRALPTSLALTVASFSPLLIPEATAVSAAASVSAPTALPAITASPYPATLDASFCSSTSYSFSASSSSSPSFTAASKNLTPQPSVEVTLEPSATPAAPIFAVTQTATPTPTLEKIQVEEEGKEETEKPHYTNEEEDEEEEEEEGGRTLRELFKLGAPSEAWEKIISPRFITVSTEIVYTTTYTSTTTSINALSVLVDDCSMLSASLYSVDGEC